MFKKNKCKPTAFKKRRVDTDGDADEGNERTGLAVVISDEAATAQAIKRRRHVLTGMQYKRGVDAATLVSSSRRNPSSTGTAADKDDPAANTLDDGKLPSNTKMTNESQVWKERHQKAMEDFIASKIEKPEEAEQQQQQQQQQQPTAANTITNKDQLFQQLAVTAKQLAGINDDEEAGSEQKLQHQEVLRSGAATAMAEVILPSSSSTSSSMAMSPWHGRKPMRRGAGGQQRNDHRSSAVLSRTDRSAAAAASTAAAAAGGDNGRIGFAAARGIPEAKPREQSADEKAYKNFVQRQRR